MKYDLTLWTGLIWFRTGFIGMFCECANENLGYIVGRAFFDLLIYYSFVRRYSATWNLSGSLKWHKHVLLGEDVRRVKVLT
jgi:hypothetical protein